MTDLTNTPAWVREIAEACESNHARFFKGCVESTVPVAGWYCPNCGGSATRRADIPRLIEVAAAMAELVENTRKAFDSWEGEYSDTLVRYPDRCGRVGETCDKCMLDASACERILAKWRGEVGE
jgi:hypothetical protein